MTDRLRFLTAGESHGSFISTILEGLPAGLKILKDKINYQLSRRQKTFGCSKRMKIEDDKVTIISGIIQGKTTGAPLCMQIKNIDYKNWKNKKINPMFIPRPGHADLTGTIKYNYSDLRFSLERANARETAMRVCVGSVCRQLLEEFGIIIGGYVSSIGTIKAYIDETLSQKKLIEYITQAQNNEFYFADTSQCNNIRKKIYQCMKLKNTLGGIFEVVALKVPIGLGSHVHWDRRLESKLAYALMSIPAIKGIEIGNAFINSTKYGSEIQDEIFFNKKGSLYRASNNAAGFEGGITNAEPIIARLAMKPISTILRGMKSINILTKKETITSYERSDFCSVPRALPIGEAMLSFVLANAILEKLGGDNIEEMKQSFSYLRNININNMRFINKKWKFDYE
jgi:chorismate synthase